MNQINFASDTLVELLGPVNVATGAPITTSISCIARLFHDDVDTTIRTAIVSGSLLPVQFSRRWAIGMRALVWLDSGAWHDAGTVIGINHELRELTITTPIPSPVSIGARVAAALGVGAEHEIPMGFFQQSTPIAGRLDYGFRGTIGYGQPGLVVGRPVRIEIDLNAAPGARLTSVIHTSVAGGA